MQNNYKMIVRYDGTRFYGWEHQPRQEMTIQGKLETVLTRMLEDEYGMGEEKQKKTGMKKPVGITEVPENPYAKTKRGVNDTLVTVIGAGRTDAGVSAEAMTCNVILNTSRSEAEIRSYLNHYLPDDISVDEIKIAAPHFHSRFNAKGKTYIYTCYFGDKKPVFDRKYLYVLEEHPDIERMRAAAELMKGMHDYKCFCGNSHFKKSSIRVVDTIEISERGPYIKFRYHGNGFLQNMVRIMTGTLLEVGYGRIEVEKIPDIIESLNRQNAGPTAPPQGLRMMSVDYE